MRASHAISRCGSEDLTATMIDVSSRYPTPQNRDVGTTFVELR